MIPFTQTSVTYAATVNGHRFYIRFDGNRWEWDAHHADGGMTYGNRTTEAEARDACERQLVEMNKRGTKRRTG